MEILCLKFWKKMEMVKSQVNLSINFKWCFGFNRILWCEKSKKNLGSYERLFSKEKIFKGNYLNQKGSLQNENK